MLMLLLLMLLLLRRIMTRVRTAAGSKICAVTSCSCCAVVDGRVRAGTLRRRWKERRRVRVGCSATAILRVIGAETRRNRSVLLVLLLRLMMLLLMRRLRLLVR